MFFFVSIVFLPYRPYCLLAFLNCLQPVPLSLSENVTSCVVAKVSLNWLTPVFWLGNEKEEDSSVVVLCDFWF